MAAIVWLPCAKAGVEPRFVEYDFDMPVGEYIWAKNIDRRHLTPDQRAAVVMKWQKFEQEQAAAKAAEEQDRLRERAVEG